MKILLIGSYPPPYGGVSVFAERYRRQFESAGHTVRVLDREKLSRAAFTARLLGARLENYDLICLNFFSIKIYRLVVALGFSNRCQLIDHNWRELEKLSPPELALIQKLLDECREIVLVGDHLKAYYAVHGLKLPGQKTRVTQPFIAPRAEEEAEIIANYPAELRAFTSEHTPLVIASARALVKDQGVDLYGLDMCVALLAELKQEHPRCGLLFAVSVVAEPEPDLEVIKRRLEELNLTQDCYFLFGHRIWPLFREAQLLVRPTTTDGQSVSVDEALHFNCPVVASDVGSRPAAATLFASRDQQDFLEKCRSVLRSQTRKNLTKPQVAGESSS